MYNAFLCQTQRRPVSLRVRGMLIHFPILSSNTNTKPVRQKRIDSFQLQVRVSMIGACKRYSSRKSLNDMTFYGLPGHATRFFCPLLACGIDAVLIGDHLPVACNRGSPCWNRASEVAPTQNGQGPSQFR